MRLWLKKRRSPSLTHFIRYDYDSHKQELIIRMPSGIHEIFIGKVEHDIISQLETIGTSVAVAQDIDSLRSTAIKFGENKSKRSPDAAFLCGDSQYPYLVIEVSYSQKQKDLPYLADAYIVDSNGSIGMVLGLDIEYKGTKKAMLQMWRLNIKSEGQKRYLESQRTVSETFRNEDGTCAEGSLVLQLRDFAIPECFADTPEADQSQHIEISYQALTNYLNKAEAAYQRMEGNNGSKRKLPVGIEKRKREETPSTSLDEEREAEYQQQEEKLFDGN